MSTEISKDDVHSATQELWRVVEKDDVDQVESLLARGADINKSNETGTTALMRAATRGRIPMVRVLLEHGADPNVVRKDGFTALMLAAFFGHQEIVRILVEHGANTDATARFGTSARMWAASRTFKGVVRYLEHPASSGESSQVATVTSKCANLPIEPTSLQDTENEPSAIQNSNELPQVSEPFTDVVPKRGFLTYFPTLNRNIRVYAWTTLLLIVAVFAHLGLDRTRRIASPSHPPVVSDKSAVAVSPSNDSFSNSIEEKAEAPSAAQSDKLISNNDTTSNSNQAATTSRVIPVRDSDRRYALKKRTPTSVSQPLPAPEPAQDLPAATQVTSERASTPKSQPAVSLEPAPKRDPAQLPTQLIGGSKGTPREGKVIQWP